MLLFVVLVLLFLAYLLVQRLSRSPFGRMLRAVREDERAAAAYGRKVFFAKYRAYLFGAALAGLAGGLFAIFISAFNPSAWTPQELLVIYAAILVGGRGNPRGVIVGVFVVYIGFIELTRFLPSPASRPEFGPAMRQVLIGLADHPDAQVPARRDLPRAARGTDRCAGNAPPGGCRGHAGHLRAPWPAASRPPACHAAGGRGRHADEHRAAGDRGPDQVLRRRPRGAELHFLGSGRARSSA